LLSSKIKDTEKFQRNFWYLLRNRFAISGTQKILLGFFPVLEIFDFKEIFRMQQNPKDFVHKKFPWNFYVPKSFAFSAYR